MNFTNRPRRGGKNTETIHDLQSQLADAKAVVTMLKKDREDAESQLAIAKAALEAEELKRMDWDVAFEGLEKQLAAAKAEIKPSHCEWNCELCNHGY